MSECKKIKTALVSVFHKDDGLDEIVKALAADGVKFLSTGGTRKFIVELGFECEAVEDVTGYPSILGGRVKTLHPKVFGGILGRRDNEGDAAQMSKYGIEGIDLVIVDLYPFAATVKSGASDAEIIEKIDIGGISLIRAAAKNFKDVVIVASKGQYGELLEILKERGAETTIEERARFAKEAFMVSSGYDSEIFGWFDKGEGSAVRIAKDGAKHLRYGENPHQKGAFYGDFEDYFEQIHGKEISYNNLLDVDAAVSLIEEFDEDVTMVIMKHNNACGVATRKTLVEAWEAALACDPVSAFGGVFITNTEVDAKSAEEMNKLFFEILIAPSFTKEALEILESKKNRILLIQKRHDLSKTQCRSVLNGVLVQERDLKVETPADLEPMTEKTPTEAEVKDLLFANKVVKNSKSNSIVLAKNGQLCASGVGQTSRVDALKQAIEKAKSFGFDLNGAVMASDAFFPFGDCVQLAHEAGVTAVIQPGGSIRDQESVDYCNANGVAMVKTGIRHFKH